MKHARHTNNTTHALACVGRAFRSHQVCLLGAAATGAAGGLFALAAGALAVGAASLTLAAAFLAGATLFIGGPGQARSHKHSAKRQGQTSQNDICRSKERHLKTFRFNVACNVVVCIGFDVDVIKKMMC
jgi:hypothetical protein